jgi:hypothetical protein
MPNLQIDSLRDEELITVAATPQKISSINPGELIPLTSLIEKAQSNEDPRATIWQAMSSIPQEHSGEIYEVIKNLSPEVYEKVATEMIQAYRHNILSKEQDTRGLQHGNPEHNTPRLDVKDEKILARGSTFNIFANHYLVDYLGRKNGSTKH